MVQRVTPGENYEKGNRPDPSTNVRGAEIVSDKGRVVTTLLSFVTFQVKGIDENNRIDWSGVLDQTYIPKTALPSAATWAGGVGPKTTFPAHTQGVHTIIARITPGSGAAPYTLTYKLTVEPVTGDHADLKNVVAAPLKTMEEFIAVVESIESAYPTFSWQDVVTKIRKEYYPGEDNFAGDAIDSFKWDDLIDEQDSVKPLDDQIADPKAIAALRKTKNVTHNGQTIDIGHVLAGVDSMNFPGTGGIFKGGKISGPAAATWSGDVASALVHWAESASLTSTSDDLKVKSYNQFAALNDMLGDYDGINLGGMAALPPHASLSQRLRSYYINSADTGANRRYYNFCVVSGFEIQNDKLAPAARAYIRQQILEFAHVFNVRGSVRDAVLMSGESVAREGAVAAPSTGSTTRDRIEKQVDWFVDRFIDELEAGMLAEH